jgi:hypothetical protein
MVERGGHVDIQTEGDGEINPPFVMVAHMPQQVDVDVVGEHTSNIPSKGKMT